MITALLIVSISLLTGGAQLTPYSCNLNLVLDNNNNTCVSQQEVKSVIQSETQSIQSEVQSIQTRVQSMQNVVDTFHSEVQSSHTTTQNSINAKFQSLHDEIELLRGSVADIERDNAVLIRTLLPGTVRHPTPSCKYIRSGSPSGYYWIQSNTSHPTNQYCDMTRRSCCSTSGGWMRVVNLDMTDPNQQCPSGFRLVTSPRRTCGRPVSEISCVSTTFPVHGVEYSRVCGRVKAYQVGSTEGFNTRSSDIDNHYIQGVSLTHGLPRKHIWTFVAALDERSYRTSSNACPCTYPDGTFTGIIPSFVGQDYFCDTGSRNVYQNGRFYHEDPLWDGQGCGAVSTCCSFNNPPWFCKTLPPTRDDIELRICANADHTNEDTPIEAVEIYVQ